MLRLGLGPQIGSNKPESGGSSISKVAISGAGSSEFDGDYLWDGIQFVGPSPYGGDNALIVQSGGGWDLTFTGDILYQSVNLTVWTRPSGGGDIPAPTGTIYYS